ncbi:MAG: Calcineurin like phosphoesterase [Candidatus Peribacteria bacterium]|nr:Calcineurin like phosphoesterase [Candidatus Peribacteria bacterium]
MTFFGATVILVVVCLVALVYSTVIEPNIIILTKKRIRFPLKKPLRIALIGDFHVGPFKQTAFMQRIVNRVNAEKPDIVLLAGDFILEPPADVTFLEPLKNLQSALGTYAVLGNHDYHPYPRRVKKKYAAINQSQEIADFLASLSITVLRNEHAIIHRGTETFALVGVDDCGEKKFALPNSSDLQKATDTLPDNIPFLLLSHQPDILLDPLHTKADAILCGHTHGGQVRLPFYGAVAHLPNIVSQLYDQGVFPLNDKTTLVITRGLGESDFPVRFWAWPEIMILETVST